jgi:hypothetical protein
MEYFELPLDQQGTRRWVIYYTNDQDGMATDKDNKILAFAQVEGAQAYAKKKKWKIKPGMEPFDLDQVELWCKSFDTDSLDCPALYRCWNLLGDVSNSLGLGSTFLGYSDSAMKIHEELFWGCNLPGMAPVDNPYRAKLSGEQVELLQEVFQEGLKLIKLHLKNMA